MKIKIYKVDDTNKLKNVNFSYTDNDVKKITIADNVKELNVKDGIVTNPIHITKITIGSNVRKISDKSFYGCTELTGVYGCVNVEEIGDYAFADCKSLKYANILERDTKIYGECCFEGCDSFETVTVNFNNISYDNVGANLFNKCKGLKTATIIGKNSFVSEGMFNECGELTSITSNTVTVVCKNGFNKCFNLQNVSLPNCLKLEEYAFNECFGVTQMDITSCKVIGPYSLYACSHLVSLNLPNCTTIEEHGFDNCTSLTNIYFQQLSKIGDYAFWYCLSLTELTLPETINSPNCFSENCFGTSSIKLIHLKGFTAKQLIENKDSMGRFGSNEDLWYESSDGIKYQTDPSGHGLIINGGGSDPQSGSIKCVLATTQYAYQCTAFYDSIHRHVVDLTNLMLKHNKREDIVFEYLCDFTPTPPISSPVVKNPTRANILNSIRDGVNGNYKYMLIYLNDHGSSDGRIFVQDGSLSGRDLADAISSGKSDIRVFIILECCHAVGISPFTAQNNLKTYNSNNQYQNDFFDEMFKRFDQIQEKNSKGKLLKSLPSNFKILGWYTCEQKYISFTDEMIGSELSYRIYNLFNDTCTYKSLMDTLKTIPYYYHTEKVNGKTIYYYSGTTKDEIGPCYPVVKNYNGNFNENVLAFT